MAGKSVAAPFSGMLCYISSELMVLILMSLRLTWKITIFLPALLATSMQNP